MKTPRKCIAMVTIDIVQLIANKRQRKREITATLMLVCRLHVTDDQVTLMTSRVANLSSPKKARSCPKKSQIAVLRHIKYA